MIETRQILEEFQLRNVLATSSTGAVFLAADPDTGQELVIKLVSCSTPNAENRIRRRFLDMVDAARVTHIRGLATITDHGLTPEGDGFLVMNFLDGQTLVSIDDVDPAVAVSILIDVLGCVEDLAAAGTAHLNLKPTNVFVTNAPDNDRAVVLGFGSSATLLHTDFGVPVPADDPHLAPELVAGKFLPLDQAWRSDLFSLGVVACGVFGAEIAADGYDRPRITLPPAVASVLGEVEPLERVLGQIMEPDPMRRGSSPSDLRDPLIRALPPVPRPATPAAPATSRFDPNKTDPALVMSATAAAGPTTPAFDLVEEAEQSWPDMLFDVPGLPEVLDPLEDTDVGDPVPDDVWVPKTDAPEVAAREATPVALPTVPPVQGKGGARRVPSWELAAVSAAVVVLGTLIAFAWFQRREHHEPAVANVSLAADVPSAASPDPGRVDGHLFGELLRIQGLVEGADLDAARAALDAFVEQEGVSFSSDESALYNSLVAAVTRAADRDGAVIDLRGGLKHGSIKMLRRGVAGVAGLRRYEISEVDGLAGDLERGRESLRLYSLMKKAEDEGDSLGVIENAGRLAKVLPGYSGAPELRREAADEVERRAEAYVATHRYEEAIAVYESLLRVWPDLSWPAPRIAWCREQIADALRTESTVVRALAKGEAGDPEAGLALLDELNVESHLQKEVDEARARLELRLAEIDAEAPRIEVDSTVELAFKKNQTLTVPLKVTDDYRTERVVVHARNESDDGFLQVPVESAGDGVFTFTITPELHGNQNVYFYVVAKDRSGHIGRLGSQDAPIKVDRTRWLKKLLQ